ALGEKITEALGEKFTEALEEKIKEALEGKIKEVLEKITPLAAVIIIDADILRMNGANISRHLSWAKTAEDLVRYATSDTIFTEISGLDPSPDVIVRFDCDGVIHIKTTKVDSRSTPSTTFQLYCSNPELAEGDHVGHNSGSMPGATAAFTAGLAAQLIKGSDLNPAIKNGLKRACHLVSEGFSREPTDREPTDDQNMSFTYPDISKDDPKCAQEAQLNPIGPLRIPSNLPTDWNFLNQKNKEELNKIAEDIVNIGIDAGLKEFPVAKYGPLCTADRQEMESFRAISNLLEEYMHGAPKKPLSIGAFGKPGSGKSFGLKAVINEVARRQGKEVQELEFNLSQLLQYNDLLTAFHTIRDQSFSGKVPVVLFDEFDSAFQGKPLGWLQYFLAPMQDGTFFENGCHRPLGSAIFVFIGGTSPTFEKFRESLHTPEAVAAKKPDFVSRLRGFVNIWGPEKINRSDKTYSIRRAIILRYQLNLRMLPKHSGAGVERVHQNVLRALLRVPSFRHGNRSLESILHMSRIAGREYFGPAALPIDHQLDLHVDATKFVKLLKN
ncbi:hypothetical protein BDV36DRAFT_289835, partial [Aspergillus pseudocaelatus]